MSQSPQEYSYKKVKKAQSQSQGWGWPHLAAVPKKPATTSLHIPDEPAEVSPTATEENTVHQSSPPRYPHPLAASSGNSATPGGEAAVSEDQIPHHVEDDMEPKVKEEPQLAGEDTRHKKETNIAHAEGGDLSKHAEDNNKIKIGDEGVEEKPSSHSDESIERSKPEGNCESSQNHGEDWLRPRFEESADAEEEVSRGEGAERIPLPGSPKSITEEPSATESIINESPHVPGEFSEYQEVSPPHSPKKKVVMPSEMTQIGEELSKIESPVIVRDFGTPPLKEDTTPSRKFPMLPPPRIVIQRASDTTESGTPYPSPAAVDPDKQLHGPHPSEESDRLSGRSQGADPLASRIAIPPEISDNLSHDVEKSEKAKVKKRKLVVRKSRNIVMRKHFLQLCLGRQLAEHAKPALRLLANGEDVNVTLGTADGREPMLHMSEGSTLDLSGYEH